MVARGEIENVENPSGGGLYQQRVVGKVVSDENLVALVASNHGQSSGIGDELSRWQACQRRIMLFALGNRLQRYLKEPLA